MPVGSLSLPATIPRRKKIVGGLRRRGKKKEEEIKLCSVIGTEDKKE